MVAVVERRVAALVPPRLSAVCGPRSACRLSPLPLAELLPLLRAGSLRYGLARVDASGVVSNRSTIRALGWRCGDQLQVSVVAGSVVVHRDPGGVFRMPAKPYLVLPSAVRHRCGLRAGEQVLVAADPHHDVLVVHPLAALDAMVLAFHAALLRGEADDQPRT